MTTDKDTEALIKQVFDDLTCAYGTSVPWTRVTKARAEVLWLVRAAVHARQDRIKELEAERDTLKEAYKSRASLRASAAKARVKEMEAELTLAKPMFSRRQLEEKLAEAREELGDPDEWAGRRKELEGWTGSAWLAGEGNEDLRSECYSFLCGLLGYLQAAEDASRAIMQKMEGGTDAGK